MKFATAVLAGLLALFLGAMLLFAAVADNADCIDPAANISGRIPSGKVAGYGKEQLKNAATIAQVAKKRGLSRQAQKVGIMTAMGESSLVNIGYGDDIHGVTNPDGTLTCSLGLFQQQWCKGWGTKEQVLDPVYASNAFFDRLVKVSGWEKMAATLAIHAVQRNADAQHYARYEGPAEEVLQAISGKSSGASCSTGGGPVTGGWTNPIGIQPWGTYPNHSGGAMDVHVGVGTPVRAPAAGTIVDLSEGCGGLVLGVQHDRRYTTVFAHLSAFAVKPGTKVKAGQLIAYSGASGSCVDGAHLHFEVRVGPTPKLWGTFSFAPAYRFMREHGVTMGLCVSGCDFYPR